MSSFCAAMFSDLAAAQEGQRQIEKLDDEGVLKVASSVVISRDRDGQVVQHNGRTPGALGAGLGAIAGGLVGMIGGPLGGMMGAAGGALSGGWFDLLRVEERDRFLGEIARHVSGNHAALLAEVVSASDDAKRTVESRLAGLGGTMVGKGS